MLNNLRESVQDELNLVLLLIEEATHSNIPLIQKIQSYVLKQPEKKLIRPLILLLLAQAVRYSGKQHITLAAIIEMIHGATLLHDDVIDKADTRRNKITTHKAFGTTQSILMGDFIYASAFKLIADLHSPDITSILAQATKEIVEGEVLQLSLQGNLNTSLDNYLRIIRAKTALLFMTGAQCIEHLSSDKIGLSDYGYHFGMLYQITDDILDIDVNNKQLNKAHGTDLKEGKMTLPTILAYQHGTPEDQKIIKDVLAQKLDWEAILPIFERTKAIEKCQPYLEHHIKLGEQALDKLPNSIYKSHLLQLLSHIPNRKR